MAGSHTSRLSVRRIAQWCCGSALAVCLGGVCLGQSLPAEPSETPIAAENGFLQSQGAQPRFQSANKISPDAMAALRQQRVLSVPHFSSSFAAEGRTFPLTMVGRRPQAGGTTQIPTQIIAVSLLFDEFADQAGDPIVLDPGPVLSKIEGSPNFRSASYLTGFTQFADAVQRAQFFRIMAQDWHTLLLPPQFLRPVVIEVPRGLAKVYRNSSSGTVFALVDTSFFISHLNTLVQLEELRADALTLILTSNVFLAPKADPAQCCVLGFHTAFATGRVGSLQQVQTLAWASWIEQGLLGSSLADVTPLSHEISEWMNNPFGTNTVPAWQPLGQGAGSCQTNLETADPVAALPNAGFPVTVDGFAYHPQTQVLLPWFIRQGAQDSIDGAFSFPDESLVTGPSQPCTEH